MFRGNLRNYENSRFPCKCMFSLMTFIVNNQEHFQTISSVHSSDARTQTPSSCTSI